MRGDLGKGVRYYELALAAVPGDLDAALQLGYAWIALGSLEKAGETFGGVITRARELQQETFEGWGHNGQGDVRMAQGDGAGALAAYQAALAIAEGLAQRDPANTEWQRDLFISQSKVADVLWAQGDGPAALKAYQSVLATNEALAQRDPANTGWQVDVAVSCWKMASLDAPLSIPDRRELLQRGRQILSTLKDAGRLQANPDWIGAFDQALADLP